MQMALSTDGSLSEMHSVERLMIELTAFGDGDVTSASAFHLATGGSRVRSNLALHAGQRLGLDFGTRQHIAAACELLHNASLIHDDMQDSDLSRRGNDTVWKRFGRDTALLTGDLFISAAYASIAAIKHGSLPELLLSMHEAVATAIRGQASDLSSGKQAQLNLSEYEAIAIEKSGALLSLPLEMCLSAAGQQSSIEKARSAVKAFALAYQMSDDISDQVTDAANRRPNIVVVLSAYGIPKSANGTAAVSELALAHLNNAIDLAAELPFNSGQLLINYANKLRTALPSKAAA